MFFLLFAGVFFLPGCDRTKLMENEYIVKIDGEEIGIGEYLVYLKEAEKDFESIGGSDIWDTDFDGQTAAEAAKESALNGLKMVKISNQRADSFDLVLSEEEKEEAKKEAEKTYQEYSQEEKEQISQEDIYQVMCDQALYSKVNQKVTQNLVINEEDFESYYTRSKEEFAKTFTSYTLDTIFTTEYSLAEQALQRVKAQEDFLTLAEEYMEKEGQENGKKEIVDYRSNLEASFGISFDLEKGETSGILTGEKGYYIFKVREKHVPEGEELRQEAYEYYDQSMKHLFFNQEYQKWMANSIIEKNEAVWASVAVEK